MSHEPTTFQQRPRRPCPQQNSEDFNKNCWIQHAISKPIGYAGTAQEGFFTRKPMCSPCDDDNDDDDRHERWQTLLNCEAMYTELPTKISIGGPEYSIVDGK